jgi:hypothetical protein
LKTIVSPPRKREKKSCPLPPPGQLDFLTPDPFKNPFVSMDDKGLPFCPHHALPQAAAWFAENGWHIWAIDVVHSGYTLFVAPL